jgi:hypothetical protein
MYLRYGLFAFKPMAKLKDILAKYHESPGTKAYTKTEVKRMFAAFQELKTDIQLTPYDLRYGRDKYLPGWTRRLVPKRLGWFIITQGQKATKEQKGC